MSLEEKVAQVKANIAAAAREVGRDPSEITLVAATKVQTSDTIRQAIAAGITICGENRVQEMTAHLDDDAYAGAALHFIGHLQTNKVKQVVGRVDLIESVGSEHLLDAIEAQAAKLDLVQDILLDQHRRGGVQKRYLPRGAARSGPEGGSLSPCESPGADGHSSGGRGTRRQPALFCENATAFC